MITVTCEKCNSKFEFTAPDLKETTITMEGEELFLTHYICPNCNKIYTVLIDNAETKKALSFYTNYLASLAYKKRTGKQPSKKELAKLLKLQEQLKHKRDELQACHNGQSYQLYDRELKLELCVPNTNLED